MNHALPILPARGHGLFGHDVPTCGGNLNRLIGVEPARCGQDDNVGIGSRKESLQAPEAWRASAFFASG